MDHAAKIIAIKNSVLEAKAGSGLGDLPDTVTFEHVVAEVWETSKPFYYRTIANEISTILNGP
eukprot:989501-Pyramimonas_sp.AAC.1